MAMFAAIQAAQQQANENINSETDAYRRLGAEDRSSSNRGRRAGQQGNAAQEESLLSQWQSLREKLDSTKVIQEASPLDDEVVTLLRTVFKDHLLAESPEYAKYFQADLRGGPEGAWEAPPSSGSSFESSTADKPVPTSVSTASPAPAAPAAPAVVASGARGWLARYWARYHASPLRSKVYLTLSHPEYSPMAFWLGGLIMVIILLSTATFIVESVPAIEHTATYDRLVIVDYVCLGIFTLEFLARLATCGSLRHFVLSFMNWIDFMAILPFYIELVVAGPGNQAASQSRIIRLLRLLRILRLLRATARFRNLQVVVDSLVASADVLGMLLMLLLVLLVVSSTVIYYIENALVPDSWFDSIPTTMYYMHTTLTTTGYGDLSTKSAWGRFVVGGFMLACMVTMSLPISVIGGNFSSMWGRYVAIRDGLGRSRGAWSVAANLRGAAETHCGALDDLVGAINRAKCALEDGRSGLVAGEDESGPIAAPAAITGPSFASLMNGGLKVSGITSMGPARPSATSVWLKASGAPAVSPGSVTAIPSLGLRALADEVSALRGRVAAAVAAKEDPSALEPLRYALAALRARLADAQRRSAELQALLALSSRVTSRDLAGRLEALRGQAKELRGWGADGAWMEARLAGLLADMRAVRAVVGSGQDAQEPGQEAQSP